MALYGFHKLDEAGNVVPCNREEWLAYSDANGGKPTVIREDVISDGFVLRTVFGGMGIEPDGACMAFGTFLYTEPDNSDGKYCGQADTLPDAHAVHDEALRTLRVADALGKVMQ